MSIHSSTGSPGLISYDAGVQMFCYGGVKIRFDSIFHLSLLTTETRFYVETCKWMFTLLVRHESAPRTCQLHMKKIDLNTTNV